VYRYVGIGESRLRVDASYWFNTEHPTEISEGHAIVCFVACFA